MNKANTLEGNHEMEKLMANAKDETTWFDERVKEFADDPEYMVHGLLLGITEDICRAMAEQSISNSELANRLNISQRQVIKFLNTPLNTTLESIVRFAQAVGLRVKIESLPQ